MLLTLSLSIVVTTGINADIVYILYIVSKEQGPGESITVTIQLCHQVICNIILLYRPPSEHHLDNLEELLLNNTSHHYNILIGDINLPDIR